MKELNQLVANHHVVEALWSAVNTSSGSLVNVAPLIKKVLDTEAWKERVVPQLGKEPVRFQRFTDFLKAPPLRGCGWTSELVEPLIRDDPETLEKFRRMTVGKRGAHNDNIINKPRQGTSRAYTLDRLKRERPDLFDRVVAKELTGNAAAIEAGFRKKPKKRLTHCPHCGCKL